MTLSAGGACGELGDLTGADRDKCVCLKTFSKRSQEAKLLRNECSPLYGCVLHVQFTPKRRATGANLLPLPQQ